MKSFIICALGFGLMSTSLFAHDEGHGPKLTDRPKYGGKVAAVVEDGMLTHTVKYKAELVKNSKNEVKLYVYDKEMEPVTLDRFSEARLEAQGRRSKQAQKVSLTKSDKFFEGKLPQMKGPFSVDIVVKENDEELIAGFGMFD